MNILVTFWSQTGNTQKIAEAIYESISCTKELKTFEEVESFKGFDLILSLIHISEPTRPY